MSKTKFTPGPWILDTSAENGWAIYPSEPNLIGTWGAKGKPLFSDVCGFNYRGKTEEANAALIAAAPELYEMVDKINAAFYTRTSRKEWLELMEKTKPLLQKARGES